MTQKQMDKINENGASPSHATDPEALPKAKRRTFTAAYKLWALEEADKCREQQGQISKFLLLIPMQFFFTFFWPLARGSALATLPSKAGAVTAIYSLFGLLPIPLLFGWLSDSIGLTPAMFVTHLVAIILLGWLVARQTQQ